MKTRISSKKYNDKLNAIFEPEIERLKKQEARAKSVLDALQERTDIDFCGLEEWQVINIITRTLDELEGGEK